MEVTTPGILPGLLVAWTLAAATWVVVWLADRRRASAPSRQRSMRVVLALFAALTLARLGHYAATVDSEDWRLFDKTEIVYAPASETLDEDMVGF